MSIGIKAPGYYVQGAGELGKLGKYAKKMGDNFLVVISPNNKKRVGKIIDTALTEINKTVFYAEFSGECTPEVIADIQS